MSIPLNTIIKINPGVLAVGNNPNDLYGLMLTRKSGLPAQQIAAFQNADQVGSLFGYDSIEYQLATVYFAGFTDSDRVADQLYVAPYSSTDSSATLIGGSLAALQLDDLRVLQGDLEIRIDGVDQSLHNPDFSNVTSFSDAAELLGRLLNVPVVYSAGNKGFIVSSSTIGGNSSVEFATGSLADALMLSQAKGARKSPPVTDPCLTSLLNTLRKSDDTFCSVFLTWEASEDEKLELAQWANGMKDDVCVILSDSNDNAWLANTGASFAEKIASENYEGVICVYDHLELCAFIAGYPAAWDITKKDGRFTAAFRRSSLLQPNVTDEDKANGLKAKGYNFYGSWASASSSFAFLSDGRISGQYLWIDSWYCQVWMRRHLRAAMIKALLAKGQIPYNDEGKGILNTAVKPAIDDFVNFGALRKGITLSTDQTQVLKQKGLTQSQISNISSIGYYLRIDMENTSPQARAQRASPPIDFWYTDGQSVQQINMNSIEIQ